MSLTFERIYPFLFGIAAGIVWWLTDMAIPGAAHDAILSSSLSLGAILTGFLATSKTILISLMGTSVMERLKSSGYDADLIQYLAHAIWLSFAFSVVSLIGFFVSHILFGVAWFGLGTMAAFAFIRVTKIILEIIRS